MLMKLGKYLTAMAVASVVALLGCSNGNSVAGNSAETGSPELAGLFVLEDGKTPAAFARVRCVPQKFDATRDSLPKNFITETDSKGHYKLDSIPEGIYSLEAYHKDSGELLLVQGLPVYEDDSLTVNDTLHAPGTVKLMADSLKEGTKGVATVFGTTILRNVTVIDGELTIDNLPEGALTLRIYLGADTLLLGVTLPAGETLEIGSKKETPPPVTTFVAPLSLPEGQDTLNSFVSDIPLALRLTPDNSDFDALAKLTAQNSGRWEVVRISPDGNRSKKIPIANAYFDTLAKEAAFWVSVDSLNVLDSLELSFDSTIAPAYASDVFPTNRSYAVVWHYDSGISPVADAAEKSYFEGTANNASPVDGVVGSGISLKSDGYVLAENSADKDTDRKLNLVFDTEDYFCFSLWVQLESISKEQTIFEKAKEYALRYVPEKGFVVESYHVATETPDTESAIDTASFVTSWASGTDGIAAGKWIYVAFSRRAVSNVTFFVNANKVKHSTENSNWDGARESLQDFKVGGFTGKIDELMLGGCFRDDSWSRLTYLNQKPSGYWPILTGR
jgi:hypothetical protein